MDSATLAEILGETPQIDDEEFGIPTCETVSTLESIIHEDEEQIRELDNELLAVPEITDVMSMSSCDSAPSMQSSAHTHQLSTSAPSASPKLSQRVEALRKPVIGQRKNSGTRHGRSVSASSANRELLKTPESNIVLKRGILSSVSTQLRGNKARAGAATCVEATTEVESEEMAFTYYIAVGTGHGLTFVYDAKQVMKWCLGDLARSSEVGAVSCLAFNMDSSRLLVGHARGLITMWDLTSGKLLRRITDAHPPGNAVLYLRFTDDPTLALLVNSGGSVFQLEFKRSIKGRSCDSSCLFSGSRGEICCLEPLHLMATVVEHPIYQFRLIAMASFTKIFILTLKGNMAVKFTHPLPGDAATLPLLAWQWVAIEQSKYSDRVMEPILAFARDHCVHLLQVGCNGKMLGTAGFTTANLGPDLSFRPLRKITVDYTLLSVQWMTHNTMSLIDTKEELHLIDIPSAEVLEVCDLSSLGLCYNSSLYKSLATDGNVSELLAYAGESACYHSICVADGQLVILGVKSVSCLTIRSWRERLATLSKRGRPELTVKLALALMTGQAKGVKGLARETEKRKEEVKEEARRVLSVCVQEARQHWKLSDPRDDELMIDLEEWRQLAVNCIELHFSVGLCQSQLYEELYTNFCAAGITGAAAFHEALLPLIRSGRISSLPPALIQDLVEHCRSRGRLNDLETAIVKLEPANLDLDQVIRICRRHDLFDAFIHLSCTALMDYRAPLDDMCALLRERMQGLRQDDEGWPSDLGNKLLVFINACLSGRSYVTGDKLEEEEGSRVQALVFDFLLEEKPGGGKERYPNLTTLLLSNSKDFLNVLALAFDEPVMRGPQGMPRRQLLIDSLVVCMTKQKVFSLSQVGSLFVFIARQLVRPENAQLQFDKNTFDQVLEWLCQVEDRENAGLSELAEQQQVIIDLLTANQAFGKTCYSEERLLVMAHKAQFYQVMEFLHRKNGRFVEVVSCYLDDPYRKEQVFNYLKESLSTDSEVPQRQKLEMKSLCMERIKDLADVSAEKTVSLLVKTLHERIETLVGRLKRQPYTLFLLLRGYFDFCSSRESSPLHYGPGGRGGEGPRSIDPVVSECYIELMVEYDTSELEAFLRTTTDYRTQAAINMVKHCDEPRAMAYLYEKAGKPAAALEIYIQLFNADWTSMLGNRDATGQASIPSIGLVEKSFKECVEFCKKNSASLECQSDREKLWFPLLDCVLEKQRELDTTSPGNRPTIDFIKSLSQAVISAMSPHISVPAILQRILQDPLYAHEKMADLKEMILGMLVTFNYESTLLGTCCRLVGHDLVRTWSQYVESAQRGFGPRKYRCESCRWPLCGVSVATGNITPAEEGGVVGQGQEEVDDDAGSQMIFFRCGHGFHAACLLSERSYLGFRHSPEWLCAICAPRKPAAGDSTQTERESPSTEGGHFGRVSNTATLTPISWDRLQSFQESSRRLNSAEVLKQLSQSARDRERNSTPGGGRQTKLMIDSSLNFRIPSLYDET